MIQKKRAVFAYEEEPAFHLRSDDAGQDVLIKRPHKAVLQGLTNAAQIATITPHCELPVGSLNGVPFEPWEPPEDADGWGEVDGQLIIEDEPDVAPLKPGQKFSTGLVIMEPDGRLWMASPTNGFGGYAATFPKGRFEEDEWSSWQSNAIKEAWEETGLKAAIVAFLGDVDRSTTRTRYYLAKRTGGTPTDMGWESQAVHLVPLKRAREVLDSPYDHKVVELVEKVLQAHGGRMPDPWSDAAMAADAREREAQLSPQQLPPFDHPGYLGNPEVVNRLIAKACVECERDVREAMNRRLDVKEMIQAGIERAKRYAAILHGKDPAYVPMKGYHDGGLGGKLRADLREWWPRLAPQVDDDPFAVLFLMVQSVILDAYMHYPRADQDPERARHMAPYIQYAVQVILGIEEREKAH